MDSDQKTDNVPQQSGDLVQTSESKQGNEGAITRQPELKVDESDASHKSTDEERTPQGSPPTSDHGGEEGDGEDESGSSKRVYSGDKPPPHRALLRRKSSSRGRGAKGKLVMTRRSSNELSPTTVQSEINMRAKSDAMRPAIFTFSPGGTASKVVKTGPSPTTGDLVPTPGHLLCPRNNQEKPFRDCFISASFTKSIGE